jgi:hypothetical protein
MRGISDDDLDDLRAHHYADLLTGTIERLGGEVGRWATRLNGRPQVADHTGHPVIDSTSRLVA